MQNFRKILVLNRGEIACRIIQTCQEMGKLAVAVYSHADCDAPHVHLADAAIALGGTTPKESYLDLPKLVGLAKAAACDAVHPGYGFLSERADAASAFLAAGIAWIGPSPSSIHQLGNKIEAKKLLDQAGVPTLPWSIIGAGDKKNLATSAAQIGYPLLVKAAAGGGGKGMRLVQKADDIEAAAESAAREGLAAFGDGAIFMEKYLSNPRHIEVQILGDHHGNTFHFGDRDCSSQRRHQKVIEEAPSPNLSGSTRQAICNAARNLAHSVGYANAGTAEFLVDAHENFYFLEMNSRLQVEHSVTEATWGIDLVRAQINVAEGAKLTDLFPNYEKMRPRGCAIQTRIYAEDPAQMYMPCPGTLVEVSWPKATTVRIDTAVASGSVVSLNYDPMIAKLTVWGETRAIAIEKSLWALRNTVLFGTITNINYLQDILASAVFRAGKMHVKFLETEFKDWQDPVPEAVLQARAEILQKAKKRPALVASSNPSGGSPLFPSPWEGKNSE